jgi:hypothetical protein
MSYEEYENVYRYPKDSGLSFTPKDSKACAGAIRALQDRLKQIESENTELRDKLIVHENRANNDREKWQIRIMEEVQLSKDKETLLQSRLYEREEEIKKLMLRFSNMEDQLKIKETQCRHVENESKRNSDQYAMDIESLNLQIEILNKNLNEKNNEGKYSHNILEKIEREKNLVEEELKQEKRINQSLQSEVNFLRDNSEHQRLSLQKNFETLETELTKQNADYFQKIKELEIKNKSLRDLNANQTKQIEHLKKEISELLKAKKFSEDQKIEILKSKGIELPKKTPSKSMSKPTFRSKSPGTAKINHKKEKSLVDTKEILENEEDLRKSIANCEKDLEKLNQRYKSLLNLSYKESGDLSSVRKDMGKLADEIDQKSEELYDLKKRQQQFLRAKLIS